MKTPEEIRDLLKRKTCYTAKEVKLLAAELLYSCPPSGRGVHRWIFHVAAILQRKPFKFPADNLQSLLVIATRECGRDLEEHEIPDAINNSSPKGVRCKLPIFGNLAQPKHVKVNPDLINLVNEELSDTTLQTFDDISPIVTARHMHPKTILLRRFPDKPLLAFAWDKYSNNHAVHLDKFPMIIPPWLVPNPIREAKAENKTRPGESARSANNLVWPIRYLVVEWDAPYTLDEQTRFLLYINAQFSTSPLKMVIYSGSESLHGWFFPEDGILQLARKLDACSGTLDNPAELVRMPNATNPKTGKQQTVYYLV